MCEAPLNILRKVPYVPSVPPAFEEWEGMSAVSLIACENVSQAKTAGNQEARTVQKLPAARVYDVKNSRRQRHMTLQTVFQDPMAASGLVRFARGPDPAIRGVVQQPARRQVLDLNRAGALQHGNNAPRNIVGMLSNVDAIAPKPDVVVGSP